MHCFSYIKITILGFVAFALTTACGANGNFHVVGAKTKKATQEGINILIHNDEAKDAEATASPNNGNKSEPTGSSPNAVTEDDLNEDRSAILPIVISGAYLACAWASSPEQPSEEAKIDCSVMDTQGSKIPGAKAYQARWKVMLADGSMMIDEMQADESMTDFSFPVPMNSVGAITEIKVEIIHGDKVIKELSLGMEEVAGESSLPQGAFEALSLSSVCEGSRDNEARWRITNPNTNDVQVRWSATGEETQQQGTLTVAPGQDNFFVVARSDDEQRVTTIVISWQDVTGSAQQVTATNANCHSDDDDDDGLFDLGINNKGKGKGIFETQDRGEASR